MPDNQTTSEPLLDRLFRASVGGCSCLTKSPDIRWHDPLCHYRLFVEASGVIALLQVQRKPTP